MLVSFLKRGQVEEIVIHIEFKIVIHQLQTSIGDMGELTGMNMADCDI